jgi:hypothetical protein
MSDAECCRRCGCDNPPWHAPSPLWNKVMRGGSINGEPAYEDMVCATCFMVLAEKRGIATIWRVHALEVKVPLETVTPSGRVWSEDQFLWVDGSDGEKAKHHSCKSKRPQEIRGVETGPADVSVLRTDGRLAR